MHQYVLWYYSQQGQRLLLFRNIRNVKLWERLLSSEAQSTSPSREDVRRSDNRRAAWSKRLSGRAARYAASVPPNAPSSSSLAARLRRSLDTIEKKERNADPLRAVMQRYQLDSLAAEKFFESHKDEFPWLTARRRELKETKAARAAKQVESEEVTFPLEGIRVEQIAKNEDHKGAECRLEGVDEASANTAAMDRGFYVRADEYKDEYVAGSLRDLPDEEMTESVSSTVRYGPENAVEEIDFQQPFQDPNQEKKHGTTPESEEEEEGSWMENYGSVDPSLAASSKSCVGCGAKFHCKDASLPGFLPLELFLRLESKSCTEDLCRRCYLLKNYNFLLNVNVVDVDYRAMMEHLKLRQEALIVAVADMCDLPASLHSSLPSIIGEHKPLFVVGNKMDLLPPDRQSGYLRHFRDSLKKAVEDVGFSDRFNLLHVALVSAKTGFGVEDLISNIFLKWCSPRATLRSDVYLVGCTNVGKSTLFNTLLQSDLCKVRAMDLVDRATTSPWPGTTISLLKFPIMNPSPHKLELRRRRLLSNRKWELKEKRMLRDMTLETGDSRFATLQARVGNSFKKLEEELQPISVLAVRDENSEGPMFDQKLSPRKQRWNPNLPEFAKGNWCYDTPGTVNDKQVLSVFTLEELVTVLPRKMLLPRTFVLFPGQSLLIGGVALVDILEVTSDRPGIPVYLSVFASDQLPVNVMKSSRVRDFLVRYLGIPALAAPIGNANRLSQFPELKGEEMSVTGVKGEGAADVVLSSIGWVCVTSDAERVTLRGSTPAGRGLALRTPPILRHCASSRGARIPGTAAFRVKPVEFPVSERSRQRPRRPYAQPEATDNRTDITD